MINTRTEPVIGCCYSPQKVCPEIVLCVSGLRTVKEEDGYTRFLIELLEPSEMGTDAEPTLISRHEWLEHGFTPVNPSEQVVTGKLQPPTPYSNWMEYLVSNCNTGGAAFECAADGYFANADMIREAIVAEYVELNKAAGIVVPQKTIDDILDCRIPNFKG